MVVLEWFLYLVGIVIGYASFRFNWWLFPKKLSRWKRYRMSEYDFFVDRVIAAVAGAVVFGGGSIYCVYMAFHEDLLKPKKTETAVVQPAPMIQENTGKTSASKSTLEATEQPIPNGAELDEVTEIVHLWDKAHNQRNYVLFDSLYMDYVRFYGQEWEKQRCVASKKQLFQRYADFFQQSKDIRIENQGDGRVKVLFDKRVYYSGRIQTFPSYLWLNQAGDIWKIEVESDEVTDANLR